MLRAHPGCCSWSLMYIAGIPDIIVWILPRSDYWVVSPCRWQGILGLPRPVMPSGRQAGGRQSFPCPCQGVSLIASTGPRQSMAGARIFGGISGCTQSVLLQMQRSILRGTSGLIGLCSPAIGFEKMKDARISWKHRNDIFTPSRVKVHRAIWGF